MTRAELLTAALDAVNKRPKAYGPPEQNFERIAALWTDYCHGKYPSAETGVASIVPRVIFDAVDVACMMVLMKVARLEETPDHIDSWTDIAGYAACGAEVCGATIEHEPAAAARQPTFKVGDRVKTTPIGNGLPSATVRGVLDGNRYCLDYDNGFRGYQGWAASELMPLDDEWIAVPKGEPFPSDLKAGDRIRLKGGEALEGEALEGEGTYRIVIPDGEYGARDTYRGASVTLASRRRPRWYKRAEST